MNFLFTNSYFFVENVTNNDVQNSICQNRDWLMLLLEKTPHLCNTKWYVGDYITFNQNLYKLVNDER